MPEHPQRTYNRRVRLSITTRRESEPVADLTTHRVLHRAMCVDSYRLTNLAAALTHGTDDMTFGSERTIAVCDYLTQVLAMIRSHQATEDKVLWPVIEAAAGGVVGPAMLAKHTTDHHRLGQLLDRTQALTDQLAAGGTDRRWAGRLSAELRVLSRLLERHVTEEERQVFPLITCHVRVDDYAWVLQQSRLRLPSALLPFAVPWIAHHACPDELPRMLTEAWPGMRVVLQIFADRFTTQHHLVFGWDRQQPTPEVSSAHPCPIAQGTLKIGTGKGDRHFSAT